MQKFTLEELAEKVNNDLKNNSLDNRISKSLSQRRIRDYISKNVIDKGIRDGKNVYYTVTHYEQLIAVRNLQNAGYNDKMLSSISVESNVVKGDSDKLKNYKNDALDIINSIKDKSLGGNSALNSCLGYLNIKSLNQNEEFYLDKDVKIVFPPHYNFEENHIKIEKKLKKIIKKIIKKRMNKNDIK
jgi:DNA-binding transcriptional MerR regulator